MSRKEGPAPRILYAGGFEGLGAYPEHRHEHAWELILLCEGEVTEQSGNERFLMKPGNFVVHPPGAVHGDSATAPYFLYHVLVASERPLEWPRFGEDPPGEPIRALLGMVVREWYQHWIHREAFLRHCAAQLDILLKRCAVHSEESNVALNSVAAVLGRFRREFRSPIDMRFVASDLGISRSTLYAYFHQVLGRTPQEALDEIRLKHAVYLLKHSGLPVEEVARGSGYCSASHLGRKLRAVQGMTASQIRASIANQEAP